MTLRCQTLDCVHNDKEKCFAQVIEVIGKHAETTASTTCNSYAAAGSLQNYEFANEFMATDKSPSDAQNIKCAAERCLFNDHQACTATDVAIDNVNARCETFRQ